MLRIAFRGLSIVVAFSIFASICFCNETELYVFSMPGCMPCRQMAPEVDRLKQDGYPVTKIDGVANPAWARHFNVARYPTVILVSNDKIQARVTGAQNYANLKQLFDSIGFQPGKKREEISQPEVPTSNSPVSRSGTALTPAFLAHHATVRIKVTDPGGVSYATGTVIHQHESEALVITCGHVFRDSNGKGNITVEYGFAENNVKTGPGALIGYDADVRDIGLIVFKADRKIRPAVVAPLEMRVDKGDRAFSYGCDHGDDPTLRRTTIKRRVVYNGAQKYDIVGRPVDGRSGGGLFSSGGQLIGVCNAAAVEIDEGVYSALENVYWQLEKVSLSHLFESKLAQAARENQNRQIGMNSDFNATVESNPRSNSTNASWDHGQFTGTNSGSEGSPTGQNQSDMEVVITVRSKSDPRQTQSFTVQHPNQRLMAMLGELEDGQSLRSEMAMNRANFPRPAQRIADSREIRGQSPR